MKKGFCTNLVAKFLKIGPKLWAVPFVYIKNEYFFSDKMLHNINVLVTWILCFYI